MYEVASGGRVGGGLGATGGYAVTELNAMKAELRQAVHQVSALKAQKQRVKREVGEGRKTVAARNLKRAERKIGRSAVSIVPNAGIAVIISSAALEVDELCNNIEEMKAFELSLFPEEPLPQKDPQNLASAALMWRTS